MKTDSLEHLEMESLDWFLYCKRAKHFAISVPWYHEFKGPEWFSSWKHRRENEHFHHFDSHGLLAIMDRINCKVLYIGNPEDTIRTPYSNLPNILTVIAKTL